jgi:hypothetical protein
MQKDAVYEAVKKFKRIQEAISAKVDRLDPELSDQVKRRRTKEIQSEFAEALQEVEKVLSTAKTEAQSQRFAQSEPLPALFRAAVRDAEKVTPGHALLAQSLPLFGPDMLLDVLSDMSACPGLLLAAYGRLRAHAEGLAGDDKATHARSVQEKFMPIAAKYVDWKAIREAATLEHAVNAVRLQAMQRNGAEATDRLTLAREQEQLEAVMTE